MNGQNHNVLALLAGIIFAIGGWSIYALPVRSEDLIGSSFIVRDPVIEVAGGYSESDNFQSFDTLGQTISGTSTGSSFQGLFGFLFFPFATTPVITATAGNGQVALSWAAAVGTFGNITNYHVGQGTASGVYTFTSVGSTTSHTATGLTNGTTYYFVVRSLAGTLVMTTSTEVSATPSGGQSPPSPAVLASVSFSGRAYPNRVVTLLKDAQIAIATVAGPDSLFSMSLSGVSPGSYIFSIYSEDNSRRRSAPLTFPVTLTAGVMTSITDIFIAPTIDVDKAEVKRSEFAVGTGTVEVSAKRRCPKKGDLNSDCRVNILDFSIAAFWYKKPISLAFAAIEREKLNGDGKLNIVDLSIMAFYWTGQ